MSIIHTFVYFFFFNDTATTEIYTLSLHDALPILGTVNVIDACDGVDYRGLVTTGDAFEYGPSVMPLSESEVCRPDTLHGISKLRATFYAQAAARARGRPIVTLRPFSIYGPDDHPRRLIPRVIAGALGGT